MHGGGNLHETVNFVPRSAAARFASRWRWLARVEYPLGLALMTTVATFAFGVCGSLAFERSRDAVHALDIWNRWDATHFLALAQHGYRYATQGHEPVIAFLPVYPFAVRVAHLVVRDWHLAALLVSNLCAAGAFVYFFLLAQIGGSRAFARRSLLFLAVFPAAYFLHAAYSESIFLLLSIGAFYHARRGQWPLAAILAMLATGTRLPGVTLLPALAVEYFAQRNFRWRQIRWDFAWLALVPVGALVYLAINYHYFGDPFYFLRVQREVFHAWLRWPGEAVAANWDGILHGRDGKRVLDFGGPFGAFVLATTVLIATPFFLRPSYVVYFACSWVMIFCNNFPMSSPRYLLGVFPLFLLLGRLCRRACVRDSVAIVSIMLYALYEMHFVRGWWAF